MARRYKKDNTEGLVAGVILGLFLLAPYLKTIFIILLVIVAVICFFFIFNFFKRKKDSNFSLEEGIERYRERERQKYIKPTSNINQNTTSIRTNMTENIHPKSLYSYIPSQTKKYEKSNMQKGKEYEEQIANYYLSIGYHVIEHGKKFGKKDKGIDLIATRDNETLLIQCKNWENSLVKQKHLKEFIGNCYLYVQNNSYINQIVKNVFITSSEKMDYGVKKFMQENYHLVEYKVIPYINE